MRNIRSFVRIFIDIKKNSIRYMRPLNSLYPLLDSFKNHLESSMVKLLSPNNFFKSSGLIVFFVITKMEQVIYFLTRTFY